jgi:hypothetical protein
MGKTNNLLTSQQIHPDLMISNYLHEQLLIQYYRSFYSSKTLQRHLNPLTIHLNISSAT